MGAPPDELLYQTTAQVSKEEQSEQETTIFWLDYPSEEFLYAVAVTLYDEE